MAEQRYVSRELTHFVGSRYKGESDKQFDELVKVIHDGYLARYGEREIGRGMITNTSGSLMGTKDPMFTSWVVCFCDIPLEDLHIHMAKYSQFGLSFTKEFLVPRGASPLWYVAAGSMSTDWNDPVFRVDPAKVSNMAELTEQIKLLNVRINDPIKTPRDAPRVESFENMVRTFYELFPTDLGSSILPALTDGPNFSERFRLHQGLLFFKSFLETEVLSFVKCFDPSHNDEAEENYYMEREWRLRGSAQFTLDDVHRIILPQEYAKRFRDLVPDYYGQITFAEQP